MDSVLHRVTRGEEQHRGLAAVLPNPQRLLAARPSEYVRERQSWIASQVRLLESRGHYRGLAW